jgi:hypothetical protein
VNKEKNKSKNEKIGDTTETAKTPSQSVDTQGQKNRKNFNPEDLWKGVLKILEYNYGAHPADIDFIGANTFPEYHAKTTPKLMIIKIEEDLNEKEKLWIEKMLNFYKDKIKEIVKIETAGTYNVDVERFKKEENKPSDNRNKSKTINLTEKIVSFLKESDLNLKIELRDDVLYIKHTQDLSEFEKARLISKVVNFLEFEHLQIKEIRTEYLH